MTKAINVKCQESFEDGMNFVLDAIEGDWDARWEDAGVKTDSRAFDDVKNVLLESIKEYIQDFYELETFKDETHSPKLIFEKELE